MQSKRRPCLDSLKQFDVVFEEEREFAQNKKVSSSIKIKIKISFAGVG